MLLCLLMTKEFLKLVELLGELQQLKFQMSENTDWVYGTDKYAKWPANNLVSETVYCL